MPPSRSLRYFKHEFHISRKSREAFGFDETFFSITGDVIFANSRAAQTFAAIINDKNRILHGEIPGAQVSASEINAMGLFHEVLHFVIDSYISERNPDAFGKLERWLSQNLGGEKTFHTERSFVQYFPPTDVYKSGQLPTEYLTGESSEQRRSHVLTELLLLWIENRNPAFNAIAELIDDSDLRGESSYEDVIAESERFFELQPSFGPANSTLIQMLLAPIEAHPDSILDQLDFIARNWESIIGKSGLLRRLLGAVDFIREEGKYFMMMSQALAEKSRRPEVRQADFRGFGERESPTVLTFRGAGREEEQENFSPDLSWMPRVVMIAKNAFVWLDQLSRKYKRSINRLDEIPDEELDVLAAQGFTGLWLIGIWARSTASKRIKQLNGNPEALASAYSLTSYDIAWDLGGEGAYTSLRDRAALRGIRLASDMVPNHMGLDSTWLIDHPDWFLRSEYPPFPNYSFSGPDLSNDERVGVYIEDGYWSKSDAAVVFKRVDRWTGSVNYIYHGNDGTHMPWNDTAQLDFTRPDVREAVIQTILHVAKKFPIIRFDAAMVLAKKHYQRLWFPEPGTGGAIPSRSNFSMTKEQFDAAIPVEFWREVVDRIQREAPDTLLLAEAFWLMEGYFVRTLGMHRVYNSAFMNMLKREENANYRQVIKNILEYNPQILKRFVNFLNNPDEETAIAQFGKDDKYFGVCVLMCTMPGLPMFGHGQIEGYTEKYGMEYSRAYRDEKPDEWLAERHSREIFPLLKMRHLFSEVDNFLLLDFRSGDFVNEDVFAYSNRVGNDATLVVYNNRYSHASGFIKESVPYRDEEGRLVRKSLADGLGLSGGKNSFCVFKDLTSGLEYIRPISLMRKDGFHVELGAYKYNVFVNFRAVLSSAEKPYEELSTELSGQGVPSIEEAILDLRLKGVHSAFYEAINLGSLKYLLESTEAAKPAEGRVSALGEKTSKLFNALAAYHHRPMGTRVEEALDVVRYRNLLALPTMGGNGAWKRYLTLNHKGGLTPSLEGWRVLFLWLFLTDVRESLKSLGVECGSVVSELRLSVQIRNCFAELGVDSTKADDDASIAGGLADAAEILIVSRPSLKTVQLLLERESAQSIIDVHYHGGTKWFSKERFTEFVRYLVMVLAINHVKGEEETSSGKSEDYHRKLLKEGLEIEELAEKVGYKFDDFMSAK